MTVEQRESRIEQLVTESQKLVGRINADQAALTNNTTELLGLFQADHGWGWGWRTPAHRLACQLKLTGHEARRLVATADTLPELPKLAAAFEHGEVSLSVAAALADVATPETETDLVEQSRHATADAIIGLVATHKRIEREAGDRPPRGETLSLKAKAGGYEIRGFLNGTNGALATKMLEQRRSELFEQTGSTATTAAALLSLLQVGPKPPSDRFLAILNIDIDIFRAHRERRTSSKSPGTCHPTTGSAGAGAGATGVTILHGPPVTDHELDAIHGELSTCWMVSRNGHPLWISCKARTAPPWMRTAMTVEQRCCAAASCDRSGVLEAHHSVPFTTKPETLFDEQVFLCPFHHRALHANGASVEFTPDRAGLVIRDHRGRVMTLTGVPTPPDRAPSQRPEWTGRGTWTAGMGSYDAYGLDVMLEHLHTGTTHPKDPGPGDPPPDDTTNRKTGGTDDLGNNRGPPPTGASHPASDNVTGGDNGGTSPPQS